MFVRGQLIFHSIGFGWFSLQAPRDALCEFISVSCVSKIQGFTMVGLIFRVPSCPWQPWKPHRQWGKLEGSWPRGFANSPHSCLCSYCCCRRINFGNYCSKGIWAADRRRNAVSDCSEGLPLPRDDLGGEQLYHKLIAFAGLSGRLRRAKDELISPHISWCTERVYSTL